MQTSLAYPHLSFEAEGEPRIAGTRYKVSHLAAEHDFHGWTAEELLRQHPDLRPEQVYAALTYFYDHRETVLQGLSESLAEAQSRRDGKSASRDELLRRRG